MNSVAVVLLTYSKAFYALGVQARRADTSLGNMQAVLHLHDAIEYCIRAVLEDFNISDSSQNLKGTVTTINKHFETEIPPKKLPYHSQMEFFNTTRGKVKHQASVPSREDTERCERNAFSFLERVCDEFFNLNFDTLSQVALVENADVRALLESSEQQADAGDFAAATVSIKKAWMIAQPSTNTFIDNSQHRPRHELWAVPELGMVHDTTNALEQRVANIETALASVMMGVDQVRYQRFEASTPEILPNLTDDTEHIIYPEGFSPSAEDVREARDFVVEMVVKWQGMGVVARRRDYFGGVYTEEALGEIDDEHSPEV